jgi:uncharacterized protein (DUF433 family)
MPTVVSQPVTAYAHLVSTPGIVGGQPHIDGTRIRVSDIVARRLAGMTAEQIVSDDCYPMLLLSQVYSALVYYEDHHDEIDGYLRAEEEVVERMIAEQIPGGRDLRFDTLAE